MNFKTTILGFITICIIACGTNKQDEANKILAAFREENKIENRESVFEIQTDYMNGNLILIGETDQPALKSKLLSLFSDFKIEDKTNLLPDSTVGNNNFGLINLSVANLRSQPNHSAELATQALMGTPVKILKKENGWLLIQTPDNYISWVDSEGVFPVTKLQLDDWKNSKRMIFTGDNGIIFENEDFVNPVSDVTMGNILEILEINQKNIKLKLPDGRLGFAETSDWTDFEDFKNSVKCDSTRLKKIANQFMGRPYLWGGTSARAMDCSGFVKTLYFMNGIILARDASLQFKQGEKVEIENDFSNLQTGDLLFFGQRKSDGQPEKITHVALSLGNTEYIHASGKIERNSFEPNSAIYSEYRKNSFAGTKRIIRFDNTENIQTIKNHPWY
jgi:cell wall-associated NlpC family hydrolase